jgi:hypothetical protein
LIEDRRGIDDRSEEEREDKEEDKEEKSIV